LRDSGHGQGQFQFLQYPGGGGPTGGRGRKGQGNVGLVPRGLDSRRKEWMHNPPYRTFAQNRSMTIQEIQEDIIEEFSMFDDWMQRYEYMIELGKSLPLIEERYKTDDN